MQCIYLLHSNDSGSALYFCDFTFWVVIKSDIIKSEKKENEIE
jgi:hypothetical protein